MILKTILLISLLLLAVAPAVAEEPPGPFDGWTADRVAAHRKAQIQRVTARAGAFFEARKALTGKCRLCVGSGMLLPGNGRTSEACLLCGGTGFSPELSPNPTGLERLYLHHSDEDCKQRRMKVLEDLVDAVQKGRLHESPLALTAYRIRDTRVFGECAAVVAETDSLTKHYPDEVSGKKRVEVVRWVLSDGEWWVLGDSTLPDWTAAARYPPELRERPTHDPAALALYEAARARVPDLVLPEGMRLTFRVDAVTPWSKRKARLEVSARPPTTPEIQGARIPDDLGDEYAPAIRGTVRGLLARYLDANFLADPAEVDIAAKPGSPRSVVFRGFSVDRLGQDGELTFGEDGLPRRLTSRAGEHTVDWEKKGDLFVPVRFEVRPTEGAPALTVELRYRPFQGLLLPYRLVLRSELGEFELRLGGFALKPAD